MQKVKVIDRIYHFICILLVCVFILGDVSVVFSQSNKIVIVAKGKIAALNLGTINGISTGQKYILKRRTSSGIIEVGIVRIEKVLSNKSGIRLIEPRESELIQNGDFLGDKIDDSLDELLGSMDQSDASTSDTQSETRNSRKPRYATSSTNASYDAEQAAEADANKSTWFAMGCLLGVVGWLVTEVSTPTPDASSLIGKDPEYVALYTDTYRAKVKKMRSGAAVSGCLVGTGVEVLIYAVLLNSTANSGY
jgi:hypothetical protein